MDPALLDTDILSEVLKRRNSLALERADEYLASHDRFTFSAITAYEVIRGMKATRASRQLAQFTKLLATSDVLPISLPVLMRAADLWAEGHLGGHPHNDADLIIAATALEARRILVTGNTSHYAWIKGLQLADWRSPEQ